MKPFGRARGVLAGCQPEMRRQVTGAPARPRPWFLPAAGTTRPHSRHWALAMVLLGSRVGPVTVNGTAGAGVILASLQRFFLAYSGVFALVALTAAVAAGLIASDRLVVGPAGRVTAQAVHRGLSLAAVGFLASHVLLEVLAHRSRAVDAVVPFLASGRTVYLGLGTLAADLVLLIVLTGVARGKFAARWAATWRAVHVTAYLGWPLAILHGLLSGRPAKPYVDWSYGACVAAVALALVIRLVAGTHSRTDVVAHPVPDRAAHGLPAALFSAGQPSAWLPGQPPPRRALPGGTHDGTGQYEIVDDGIPRVSGTS
jgi:DMSO/TMAO reductase YedYZ heme-binding membrane subunit